MSSAAPLPPLPEESLSLSLVVPVFNEEERLAQSGPALVAFLARFAPGSELIVVDDGSTDGTLEAAWKLSHYSSEVPVKVLEEAHRGKGAAVRAGLSTATGAMQGFCDVDLATPLDEFGRLVRVAMGGPILAIGSRDVVSTRLVHRERGTRELMGKAYNRVVRATLAPGIFDTQCGAKVASMTVWREILPYCRQTGFAWDVEAVALARRRGIAVWEVGIEWSHDQRTRVRPLRDGIAMVGAVPRIWGSVRRVPSLVSGPARRPLEELVVPALERS